MFRFHTNGQAKIEVFDNVGVEETEQLMVLHFALDLKNLYNRVSNDYAGIINQGKHRFPLGLTRRHDLLYEFPSAGPFPDKRNPKADFLAPVRKYEIIREMGVHRRFSENVLPDA